MNSDADKTWDRAIGKLRRKKGFCPLTPEEAEVAYAAAQAVPLSAGRIEEIVKAATANMTDAGQRRGAANQRRLKLPKLLVCSRKAPGHEERIQAHTKRIAAELERLGDRDN